MPDLPDIHDPRLRIAPATQRNRFDPFFGETPYDQDLNFEDHVYFRDECWNYWTGTFLYTEEPHKMNDLQMIYNRFEDYGG